MPSGLNPEIEGIIANKEKKMHKKMAAGKNGGKIAGINLVAWIYTSKHRWPPYSLNR